MPKLLFNLERTQSTTTAKRHGGGIYGEIVFRRIIDRKLPVEVVYDSSRWLNPEIYDLCVKHGIKMYDLAKDGGLQEVVDKSKADVFYTPLIPKGLSSIKGCRLVCTIHGLRELELPTDKFMLRYSTTLRERVKSLLFLMFPKWWRKRKWKQLEPYIGQDGIKFVTVSEQSNSSIKLFFPNQRQNKINVYYSPCTSNVEPDKTPQSLSEPYFLLVSGNRWEKNNLRAIMALDGLYADGLISGTKTIVTGAKDSSCYRYKLRNPDKFEFVGYVDDSRLAALYRDAFCFIYPTLNEGFGYPPLEAMKYGVPVLASPVTSVAEICGDGASYFNPYDIREIQMRISRILDADYRGELSRLGKKRFEIVKHRQEEDLDKLIDYIYQA